MAISPDAASIALGSSNRSVSILSLATGEELRSLQRHNAAPCRASRGARTAPGSRAARRVGLCRFEPGELEPYLPAPLAVPEGAPLIKRR